MDERCPSNANIPKIRVKDFRKLSENFHYHSIFGSLDILESSIEPPEPEVPVTTTARSSKASRTPKLVKEAIPKLPPQRGGAADWSTERAMTSLPFTLTKQLLVPPPSDPLKAFLLFLDNDLLDLIVRETNANAIKVLQKPGVKVNSRITTWKELTRDELVTFIALLLHTGTIRLHRLSDYWKQHWLFNIPFFGQSMSRNRFMLILKCLHFSPEPSEKVRLDKIRPVISHFNDKMETVYCPDKQLSLDISLALSHRRLIVREDVLNKRNKYDIKLYALADPEGVVVKYHMDSGGHDSSAARHAEDIVLKLLEEKLDCGYSVYMDNYFNSYDLAVKLLDRNTYCTGTLSTNRKNNPANLDTEVPAKGNNKSLFWNGVHIGRWMDKRLVLYISTEHDDEMIEVKNRRGQVFEKPSAIVHYNKFKAGANVQDQKLTYYPCEGNAMRWYKKVFVHIIHTSLMNAFYLYNRFCTEKNISLYDFRLSILERLLPNPFSRLKTLSTEHKLTKIEKLKLREKKDGDRTRTVKEVVRKECKGCRQNKKRVASLFECRACEGAPGYCPSCFCRIHS